MRRKGDNLGRILPNTSLQRPLTKRHFRHTKKKKTVEKLLSLDKIAQSSFFREASELRPMRTMLEEIRSTRLARNVEVTALEGPATINLPPPPLDRLWYVCWASRKVSPSSSETQLLRPAKPLGGSPY